MQVVITGASQGIGYAVAEAFAAEGHTVCIGSKTASRLKEATENLQKKYPAATIHSMQADLAKPEDCKSFGNWCLSFGTPTILINNELRDEIIRENTTRIKRVVPLKRNRKHGRDIATCSSKTRFDYCLLL